MNKDSVEDSSSDARRSDGFAPYAPEPFVRPDVVAEYLGIDPSTGVRFVRYGLIPGHPLRVSGRRTHWRFLLSEIREAMLAKKPKSSTERTGARKELRVGLTGARMKSAVSSPRLKRSSRLRFNQTQRNTLQKENA